MAPGVTRRGSVQRLHPLVRVALLESALVGGACATVVELPVEIPVQSKVDVSRFRRVLVAGFVTELAQGTDMDVAAEMTRLLQNQLRSGARFQVLEPDHPPLDDVLERVLEGLGRGGKYTKEDRDRYKLEGDRALQDADFWRKVGEEFQQPLIVAGRVAFEEQNRSGFQSEERVVRDPGTNRPRLIRGNRYLERKGYSLTTEFYYVDGRTGQQIHKEKFVEEVLYGEDTKTVPLSAFFELMDRLIPNFLGVISPQKIRGTRVLLK